MDTLLDEARLLQARIEQDREQLERVRAVAERIEERLRHDESVLEEIESTLGRSSQLRIEEANFRLRGQRLETVAIDVLRKRGEKIEVHYRDWFDLVRDEGHLVAGKNPVNTFLSQINRSEAVEKVGRRTGLYRLVESHQAA
jgi:hypothetical protein